MAENANNKTVESTSFNYLQASILMESKSDKFDNEVINSFSITTVEDPFKVKIKWSTMLELAEQVLDCGEARILIRNGYKGSQNFTAGAGIALKLEKKNDDVYHMTFYEGKPGEPFDTKAIQAKHYLSVNKKHLDATFTFLRYNEEVRKEKEEAAKVKRTTLDLG